MHKFKKKVTNPPMKKIAKKYIKDKKSMIQMMIRFLQTLIKRCKPTERILKTFKTSVMMMKIIWIKLILLNLIKFKEVNFTVKFILQVNKTKIYKIRRILIKFKEIILNIKFTNKRLKLMQIKCI